MTDDGTKYLPISDAMARDIDSGRAKDRDLADFLPDDYAQELYDQSQPGPVHAENLVPISPQQGAEMRRIDPESGSLPRFPASRRVIPAPFRRDVVRGGSHGKAWMLLRGEQIRPGDIITEVGLVVDVQQQLRYETKGDVLNDGNADPTQVAVGTEYTATGKGGNVKTYDANAEVKVFRRKS
jgi:hypothetical protein